MPEEKLLTVEQAGAYLSLGRVTVKRMVKRGELPAVRLNRNVVRIPLSALEALVVARTEKKTAVPQWA
jgi:excisionase family DNA binding protein